MNKLILFCFLFFVKALISQSPQQISYQGVARNSAGSVLSNTTIAVQFKIHQGSATGSTVFTEQHQGVSGLTTNGFGLFTTAIGSVNNLNTIDWANGPFFMEVLIDPTNGTSYTSVGTQQLMSVPYALYAAKAGNTTPTPTMSINSPHTITNSTPGSYSINIAGSTTYSAGNGISIAGGIISNTLTSTTTSVTGSGLAIVTSPSSNVFNVNVPAPTLSVTGNSISIGSGNAQALPMITLTAGNNEVMLGRTGNDYTITPITPTLDVVGGTLTGAFPTQTLTIPSSSVSFVQGNNVVLNQSGNTYTLSSVTPTLNVNGGNLTGAYPSQTLTIPSSSTSLIQGNNVALNQSGNTYTVSSVTPTLNVNGGSLIGTYPSQTLTIPSSSTSLVQGNNVALNQSGNTYTVSSVTPTLNVNGGNLTGAYPSQTLTIPSSSTSLVQGNNVSLNQSGNTYTISSVTPTLNVNGGSITGAYPSQTLTIPSSSTSLVQGNNVTLNQSGNTYTINAATTTLTAGNANVTLNQSGNTYTVSSVTPTLNVNGGSLTGTYPSQTLTIPSSSTSLVQGSNVTLNQSGNTYTINAATTTLTAGNANVTINQSGNVYTITPVTPTLNVNGGSLTGSYPLQTLTIPSSSTTLVQGNNITLNQSGNTYTINSIQPTLTAGSNVTITPSGNSYTIAAGTSSYMGTAGNVSVSGNTVNLVTTGVSSGTYGSDITNAVSTFSVDAYGRLFSAAQYTPTLLGDVIGTVNTSVVSKLRGVSIAPTAPTNGQILQYNGSAWTPTTVNGYWNIIGNTGTTAANFIGTIDNTTLHVRTNNLERAAFNTANNLTLFAGDNTDPGVLNFNGNVSNSIKVLEIATGSTGSALSIGAGDSKTGSSNAYGGTLNLFSGASTGSGSSTIDFGTASPGSSGSARSNASLKMRLNENGQLILGNITGFSPTSKMVVAEGHIESYQVTEPSIAGAGSLLGLLGSSASLYSNSTDVCGTISINIGLLGGAKGIYANITFNKTYANPPVIILTPRSEGAALLGAYISGTTATGFSLGLSGSTSGSTTYEFNYMVLESN